MDQLFFNNKIQIRKSAVHGWGVFAKEKIYADETLEESPFIILPIEKGELSSLLIDYRFNYPCGDWKHQVIPGGFTCYYNHSNNPNATWYTNDNIFVFKAIKDIEKDQEIFTYYGDVNYWADGRSKIKII